MALHIIRPGQSPALPPLKEIDPDEWGLVALGGALTRESILEAYAKGVFPWTGEHPIPWFSPDPRMILPPGDVRVTRSMRQVLAQNRFEIRFDTGFKKVMQMCATVPRIGQDGTWITPNMVRAWDHLHQSGNAHSVEAYDANGDLVGGLYGLAMGRAFFGESMAARAPNASKACLITLCRYLDARGVHFIDCQQSTDHLASMGAIDIARELYLKLLHQALAYPDAWDTPPSEAP